MPVEIERKFLLQSDAWRALAEAGKCYCQGYLSVDKGRTVRVRVVGEQGWITIKGLSDGASRAEFEYEIPGLEALDMLETLCLRPLIKKTRYRVPFGGLMWEIDEFSGENQGLMVAEVELSAADQHVPLPPWIGQEVTDDRRYFNSSLILHPFTEWGNRGLWPRS